MVHKLEYLCGKQAKSSRDFIDNFSCVEMCVMKSISVFAATKWNKIPMLEEIWHVTYLIITVRHLTANDNFWNVKILDQLVALLYSETGLSKKQNKRAKKNTHTPLQSNQSNAITSARFIFRIQIIAFYMAWACALCSSMYGNLYKL